MLFHRPLTGPKPALVPSLVFIIHSSIAKGFPASTLADSRVADGCRKDGIRLNCTGQRCSTLPPLSNTDQGKDQNKALNPLCVPSIMFTLLLQVTGRSRNCLDSSLTQEEAREEGKIGGVGGEQEDGF